MFLTMNKVVDLGEKKDHRHPPPETEPTDGARPPVSAGAPMMAAAMGVELVQVAVVG